MIISHPWLLAFGVATLLLVLGIMSGLVKSSWFGPAGAAAMFYAWEAEMTGLHILWPVVSLAVAASVVAHGLTGTHLSAPLGSQVARQRAAAP
jgi:NhaP-type Na+/H+ or K+/H+ antiporter